MNKKPIKYIGVSLFTMIVGYFIICNYLRPIPIEFTNINNIKIYHNEIEIASIEYQNDIEEIAKILRRAKGGYKDNPSCPFGVSMIFYYNNKENKQIDIGTDDCGALKFDNKYYDIKKEDIKNLQNFIKNITTKKFDELR